MNLIDADMFQVSALHQFIGWLAHRRRSFQAGGILWFHGLLPQWSRRQMGKGYPKMVEQVSLSDMWWCCCINEISVMFLVLSTAVTMNNMNHQLQIFCEKRGWLERRDRGNNLRQGRGHLLRAFSFFNSILKTRLWCSTAAVFHLCTSSLLNKSYLHAPDHSQQRRINPRFQTSAVLLVVAWDTLNNHRGQFRTDPMPWRRDLNQLVDIRNPITHTITNRPQAHCTPVMIMFPGTLVIVTNTTVTTYLQLATERVLVIAWIGQGIIITRISAAIFFLCNIAFAPSPSLVFSYSYLIACICVLITFPY